MAGYRPALRHAPPARPSGTPRPPPLAAWPLPLAPWLVSFGRTRAQSGLPRLQKPLCLRASGHRSRFLCTGTSAVSRPLGPIMSPVPKPFSGHVAPCGTLAPPARTLSAARSLSSGDSPSVPSASPADQRLCTGKGLVLLAPRPTPSHPAGTRPFLALWPRPSSRSRAKCELFMNRV